MMTLHDVLLETTHSIHAVVREIRAIQRYNPEYTVDRAAFNSLVCSKLSFCMNSIDSDTMIEAVQMITNAHKQEFAAE